ncbi:MAG TPA: universal stress protein [Arenibaculum sp.]|nr:universal stress protein [Arenibaculum sp.]
MKSILVPIEETEFLESVLQTALLTARAFDGYIEGLHLRPDFTGVIAAAGMGASVLVEDFQRDDWDRIRVSHRRFDKFMSEHGVPLTSVRPASGPWAIFRAEAPPGDAFLGQHARLFDVSVFAQPPGRAEPPRTASLETALFESGRPILVAPPAAPTTMGKTVVIAWNASTETARTLAFARPFLERAERVVVITAEGAMVEGPSGNDVVQYLGRAGIVAQARHVSSRRGPGETILEEARNIGADLLIKGAYTQSRLRQMIFGGATSHILAMATMPVLMAH